METRKMKLALSAGALALSLALAGCGGGGSSGTPSGPTQAELDKANADAAAAEAARAAEEAARKEAEEKLAKEEEEKRKAAAAASLKDAMALFTAVRTDDSWDHTDPVDAHWTFKAKYGGTTTISILSTNTDDVGKSFDRKVAGEALGKGGTMLDKVGMWSGTMVSAADKATAAVPSDTMVIYTNIGKDATKNFGDVYNSGSDPTLATALTSMPKKVAGSDFGTGNVATKHVGGAKVSGTFDGASGTYSCATSANDCTSQAGDGGGIKLAGMWTFTANAGATVMVPDANYSYFGWWLEKDLGVAGDPDVFKVHAFEDGMGTAKTVVPVSNTLSGTAKYMGPAVGKYAMVHDDGDGPSHTGGHFTAMADLTADFGDRDEAMRKVTGSIKDFVGGSDTMDTWEVKLETNDTGAAGMAVWHIGDNKGTKNGTFMPVFREAGADLDPQTLTGTWTVGFNPEAATVTGHMIGAFGATKQ